MKSLVEYILERRVISFGTQTPNYGHCVILAGGAASGKGFIKARIDMNYKNFDVDELKQRYIKMKNKGIIKDTKDYDLVNPEDTAELHQKIKDLGWKGKQRKAWNSSQSKNSKYLDNCIYDMVSDNIKDVVEVAETAKKMGYHVTLVWVVCNKDSALTSNRIRGIDEVGKRRSVPDSILKKGHEGAYKTMTDLFGNKYPEVAQYVDVAWIGYSCGWGRHLEQEYETSPVVKIKKNADNKFEFDKGLVDKFLDHQQPIDYARLKTDIVDNKNNDGEKKHQIKLDKLAEFKKLAPDFDEKKLDNVNESYADVLIDAINENIL